MAAEPIRAPAGAVAWPPSAGWLYSEEELPHHVNAGDMLLAVSADGLMRGVRPHDRAPLAAVVRLDAVVDELVQRLDDVADRAAGQDVGEAVDVAELHARLTVLRHRVNRLEGKDQR